MYNGPLILDPPPMVFECCQACRACGDECNHAKLDGKSYGDPMPMIPLEHDGCVCVWRTSEKGRGISDETKAPEPSATIKDRVLRALCRPTTWQDYEALIAYEGGEVVYRYGKEEFREPASPENGGFSFDANGGLIPCASRPPTPLQSLRAARDRIH